MKICVMVGEQVLFEGEVDEGGVLTVKIGEKKEEAAPEVVPEPEVVETPAELVEEPPVEAPIEPVAEEGAEPVAEEGAEPVAEEGAEPVAEPAEPEPEAAPAEEVKE